MHSRDSNITDRTGRDGARGCPRGERGSLTVFSLFIIVVLLISGGMAVDFMRQETTRARMQSAIDRGVLAAASLNQTELPEAVVQGYLLKSGLTGYTVTVDSTSGLNARRVSARATKKIDSFFLKFVGIDNLDVPTAGTAEESISDIEISMVLDVSGSMNETSASGQKKLAELKIAAKAFVDTIYAQADPTRTSISIVPYATQVNAGAELLSKFNVTAEHAYSNCVDFDVADFASASLSTLQPLQRTGHFDPMSGTGTRNASQFVCRTGPGFEVLPVQSDPAVLKAKIDALVAKDYTSIELGVKWGAALLEPAARPAIAALAADGVVPAGLAGRPLDPDPATALKVIVVMTDGINTNQWFLDNRYLSGPSLVWFDPASKELSIEGPEKGDQDGDGIANEIYFIPSQSGKKKWSNTPLGGVGAVHLSYPELWATVGMKYNARTNMRGMTGKSDDEKLWTGGMWKNGTWMPGAYAMIGGAEKDIRTDAICSAAKAAGIRIYSIGFEVTDDSALVLQGCATTPSHFFRVDGLSIADAFQSIANDIGKLRLTQ